jgi:hypothetical protein
MAPALLTVSFPNAAQSLAATLVMVTSTAASPAAARDVSLSASQKIELTAFVAPW